VRTFDRRRLRSGVLLVLLVVISAACEVRTEIDVRVDEDGGGLVTVAVTLDQEAAAKIADLDAQLRVEDLEATGWKVTRPAPTPEGGVRLSAEKRFTRPEQLGGIMSELTGADGPFRDFTLERTHSFGKTTYELEGVADLSEGVEAFGDDELRVALGGPALGQPPEVLEQQAGRPLSEAAPFSLKVRLPNGDGDTFTPVLGGEAVTVAAESSVESSLARLLVIASVLCGVLAILLFWLLGSGRIGGGRSRREAWVEPTPQRYRGVQQVEPDEFYDDRRGWS
jgi:hypothetical protein